jgi:pimeloyl-ACP methyl ester carboxylesterase
MTTLEDYATQVRDRLLSLPRPRVIVGASLGGLLAAMCAADADALILVNPVPCRPWHSQLPARQWSGVVHWRRDARLEMTRDGMEDADPASMLFAYRRWRDESGAVLRSAWEGVEVARPACPALFVVSAADEDVPQAVSRAMAGEWSARSVEAFAASHLGPLLGEAAASDRVGTPPH